MRVFWSGKWIILAFAIAFSILIIYFQKDNPPVNFTASTEIKKITSAENDKYILFNASEVLEIDRHTLFDLYRETIEDGYLIEEAVDKLNFFNRNNYSSDYQYYNEVKQFSSGVKILKLGELYFLTGNFHDQEKWKLLLELLNKEVNILIHETMVGRFQKKISVLKQQQDFKIEDLEIRIDNAINDYDRITKDRLAFLEEQASLARNLGIAKSTIDLQYNISNDVKRVGETVNEKDYFSYTSYGNENYFFLGYETIEEEIRLIQSRENKTAFIENLFYLEQQKRKLEQDKKLERAELSFRTAPIYNKSDFYAVTFNIENTKYKFPRSYEIAILFSAVIIGAIIGAVVVFIMNFLRKYKEPTKQA